MNLKISAISIYFLKELGGGGGGVLFKMSDTDTLAWVVKALCVCHSWKLTIRSINRFYRLPHKNAHPARLSHMNMRSVEGSRWLMGREQGGGGEWDIGSKFTAPGAWMWGLEVEGRPLTLEKGMVSHPGSGTQQALALSAVSSPSGCGSVSPSAKWDQ